MKWLNIDRVNLMVVGIVGAIMVGGIGFASGASTTVGPGVAYDFETIQAGIDAATDGDTVLVGPWEYVVTEPITLRGKAITVKSEAGPDETTVRMGTPADSNRGSVVIFENNETAESILEGFTITGGKGCWVAAINGYVGGGLYFNDSSGTVRNCAIVHNNATNGGGVVCDFSSLPTLIDCIISRNSANNYAGGAGCAEGATLTLKNCTISENSAGLTAGGLMSFNGTLGNSVTMTDCIITDNVALTGVGGGIHFAKGSASVTNCIIKRNTAGSGGGGVGCAGADSSLSIRNCTIWGNSTTGSHYPGFGGGGLGCFLDCSVEVTNSIIWGNTSPSGDQIAVTQGASALTVTYSNVAGGQAEVHVDSGCTLNWGEGNIDSDPLFVRLGHWDNNGTREASDDIWVDDDFHLKSQAGRWDPESQAWVKDDVTSPCIDAGDPMSPIGWEHFPNGGFVNMGAYGGTPNASKSYFGEPVSETIVAGDINGDGQVNRADLEIMALHWTDHEPLPLP